MACVRLCSEFKVKRQREDTFSKSLAVKKKEQVEIEECYGREF